MRSVLGQRPFEPDVAVDVAVCKVMHNLANRPVAVFGVELFVIQSCDCFTCPHRSLLKLLDPAHQFVIVGSELVVVNLRERLDYERDGPCKT